MTFFTICIWPETSLLSVSGQQNANRYRYLKKIIFDIKFSWVNPIHHLSAPKCHCSEWLRTSHYRYKEGTGFGERWKPDCAENLYMKVNYDFLNNCICICIRLSSQFYSVELSVSVYPANFSIRNYLHPAIQQIYYPCISKYDFPKYNLKK